MSKDYYNILGVDKNATPDDIKKAFRKIAHQYHPDKKDGDEAKFKEANEAYKVLSDPQKRAQYDQFGKAGGNPFSGHQQGGFGGFDFSGFQNGNMHFDFGDIDLGDIFGGFGGRRGRSKRGEDIHARIEISFKESVFGVEKELTIEHTHTCSTCKGSGGEEGSATVTCSQCQGQGKVQSQVMGIFATVTECPTCHGSGTVPEKKCPTCKGAGIERTKEKISFTIPAGIENGNTLRIQGKGNAVKGGIPGDLLLQVLVAQDKEYTRSGPHLITHHHILLSEAVLGTKHTLKLLDNTALDITIPAGTTHGTTLRVKGKGIKTQQGTGDLHIMVSITIPKKLSKEARALFEKLNQGGY